MNKIPLLERGTYLKNKSTLLKNIKTRVFMLFFCVLQLCAVTGYAQNEIVELPSKEVSIKTVISEIEKQTKYLVVFNSRDINEETKVNLSQLI